jgi:CMP-N,N'-diacetyllegionaminic acid synthase
VIGGKRVLGLIPARGGSKGVPRKNLRYLGGKPLITWTIDTALHSEYLDRVVVSTDDRDIAETSRLAGADVPFMRPASFATDEAPAISVIRHAIEALDDDFPLMAYLEPTSPFRSASDVDGCLDELLRRRASCCVTVRYATEVPEWLFYRRRDGHLDPVRAGPIPLRRQEVGPAVAINGCVYVAWTDRLLSAESFFGPDTVSVLMPEDRSLDIDTLSDFDRAEAILARISQGHASNRTVDQL